MLEITFVDVKQRGNTTEELTQMQIGKARGETGNPKQI